MKKAKNFIRLILLIFKYVLSLLFLIFKTTFKELSIMLPYENFEYKNDDNNRSIHSKKLNVVICYILISLIWACYSLSTSKHYIVNLDILFFFYIIIPFLFKTYSKYLPSVN